MKLTKAAAALVEAKRDLVYAVASLALLPLTYYFFWGNSNPIESILEKQEIPYDAIFFVGASEVVKLFTVFLFYPLPYMMDSGRPGHDASHYKVHRLPYSRRDSTSKNTHLSPLRPTELFKGVGNFLVAFILGHIALVLFGAPFIQDWMLTFQFSVILVCWLLFPLCMVIRPSQLLSELVYISAWTGENKALCRGKWRFIATLIGTWMGAVVMPLDWDRPWQRWPIPCLATSALAHTSVNLLYFIYIFVSLYNPQWVIYLKSKGGSHPSKVKYY